MRVIIGCEFSQIVTKAFRAKGHEAFSCDLLATEGNPAWHFQEDIMAVLKREQFDLGIFFPPCTYLCRQGQRWIGHPKHPNRLQLQLEAKRFFLELLNANIPRVCIENPVGVMNRLVRPTQTIQPWQFGHDFSKRTCLWLRGLPKLEPTKIVTLTYFVTPAGKRFTRGWYEMPRKSRERSRTFQGIANAMAQRWGASL